jgi:hypothetical protein
LYAKSWEDGLTDSDGWTHQAGDQFSSNPFNGIFYGTIAPSNNTGDTGSWSGNFSLPANTTNMQGAMMLHSRTVKNGQDEWFGMAYYFPTGWPQSLARPSAPQQTSLNVACPNYYSVNSCMVSVAAKPDSMFTLINSGACPASGVGSGCPWYSASPDGGDYSVCRGFTGSQCGPHYIIPPGQLILNVWHEIIMHVYYTTGNNGVVEFWHRIKGQTAWQKTVSVSGGFPTLQTGPTSFGTTVTASNLDGWRSTDQFGMYRWPSASPATLKVDSWCRATTFNAAASCFG